MKLKGTRDGKYIMATGTENPSPKTLLVLCSHNILGQYLGVYQPRLKVYELAQLSMKFERHFDAENVQFEVRHGSRMHG